MSWLSAVFGLLKLILGLFTTDKPRETEVVHAKPETPVGGRSNSDLLRECGLLNRPDSPE